MMPRAAFFLRAFSRISLRLKRRPGDNKKDLFNDQWLERSSGADAAAGGSDIRGDEPGIFASPDGGAARSDQIRVPLRLYGALLQHPAARRGIAGMPAEEHVFSRARMRECGSCRRSDGHRTQSRIQA